MKRHSTFVRSAVLAVGFLGAAVGGCGAQADSGPVTEATGGSGAELVFQDSWSATGKFSVYRFADGMISTTIGGSIGTDDHTSTHDKIDPRSLVHTFQQLHPDATQVPQILVDLDREIQAIALPAAPEAVLETPKSYSSWYNAECINQYGHCGYYAPVLCKYSGSDSGGAVTGISGQGYYAGDETWFWNDSPNTGLSGVGSRGCCADYYTAFPANWWGYTYWYGNIANWYAFNILDHGAGNLGVTIHRFHAVPC